jgi:hypothetical protein
MSISTSIPRTVRLGRSHPFVVIAAVAVDHHGLNPSDHITCDRSCA